MVRVGERERQHCTDFIYTSLSMRSADACFAAVAWPGGWTRGRCRRRLVKGRRRLMVPCPTHVGWDLQLGRADAALWEALAPSLALWKWAGMPREGAGLRENNGRAGASVLARVCGKRLLASLSLCSARGCAA